MKEEEKIILYIEQEYGNYDNYVRDLLDLYQKEKQKNEALKDYETFLIGHYEKIITENNVNMEFKKMYEKIVEQVHKDYIEKEKIREKIKELDNMKYVECIEFNQDVIEILKELLGE